MLIYIYLILYTCGIFIKIYSIFKTFGTKSDDYKISSYDYLTIADCVSQKASEPKPFPEKLLSSVASSRQYPRVVEISRKGGRFAP